MIISPFVIPHRFLLNALRGNRKCNVDLTVRTALCRENSQFQCIQRISGISSRNICQKIKGILIRHCFISSHALLHISQCPGKKRFDIIFFQCFQFKDNGAGNQCPVYLKIWIFRCRTDQNQCSILYKREKVILLPLIKPVNLIHKKNGSLSVHSKIVLRLSDHFLHIFLACHGCIDLRKFCTGSMRNDFCYRRLPCAGRSIENDRPQFIRPDSPIKQFILSDDVLLPHNLIQRRRPHAGCQRCFGFHGITSHIVK